MTTLLKVNPQAFGKRDDMNSLKVGATLQAPSLEQIAQHTGSAAAKQLLSQSTLPTTAVASPSSASSDDQNPAPPTVPSAPSTPSASTQSAPPPPAASPTPVAKPAPPQSRYPAGGVYGPIRANERLWDIAEKLSPSPSIGTDIMMRAVFKANPQAFGKRDDMNSLKVGATLRVPTLEEIVRYTGSGAAKRLLDGQ